MAIDPATLGVRLREARTNIRLTQDEVAQALGLPRTAIVHIEAGNRSVSTLELAKFSQIYRQSVASFFEESQAEEDPVVAVYRASPDFKEDSQFHRELATRIAICQEGKRLERLLGRPRRGGPPDYELAAPGSPVDAVEQGYRVAADERRRLGLGHGPVPEMTELLRAQGIWACGADLPNGVSGMFLSHSSTGMVILVSSEHVPSRRRFSYAHEYAHALSDRDQNIAVTTAQNRNDLREVRANAFAAAFLLPTTGVWSFLAARQKATEIGGEQEPYDPSAEGMALTARGGRRVQRRSQQITYEDVAALAHQFGVSYEAAAYRLNSMKIISRNELQELLDKLDFGREYLKFLPRTDDSGEQGLMPGRELVGQVVHLAIEAYRRNEISKGKLRDLSSLLGVSAKELVRLAEVA
jgi:Zn-dependent peptidase ImmA (M78 family)/DNA-binding XRE family transcriptional regulator